MAWGIFKPTEDDSIMKTVLSDIEKLKQHDISCDERHRRHDDKVDKIIITLDKICANTDVQTRHEYAKKLFKEYLIDTAKVVTAITAIIVAIWHGIEYLVKFATI